MVATVRKAGYIKQKGNSETIFGETQTLSASRSSKKSQTAIINSVFYFCANVCLGSRPAHPEKNSSACSWAQKLFVRALTFIWHES